MTSAILGYTLTFKLDIAKGALSIVYPTFLKKLKYLPCLNAGAQTIREENFR